MRNKKNSRNAERANNEKTNKNVNEQLLVVQLGKKDRRSRIEARQSLITSGESVIPTLTRALLNPKEQIRIEASKVLDEINIPWEQYATPQIIKLLIEDLGNNDGIVRVTARRLLVLIGEKTIGELGQALQSKNKWIRWESAKALGQIGNPAATQALIVALQDKMFDVRWLAAESLIAIGKNILIPLLKALATTPDSLRLREGVHHVLHGIINTKLEDVILPVLNALEDIEPSVEAPIAAEKALSVLAKKNKNLEDPFK